MSVYEGLKLPNIIYSTTSKHNKSIQVVESKNVRRLVVNDHTQSISAESPLAERMVWGRTVKLLASEVPNLKNVLVLGMGGGTMQHLIARQFPGIVIVSVDIDDVMIDVAKKYFDVDKIPNHFIIEEDACRVIIEPHLVNLKHKFFQAVVVDIFIGDEFPNLGTSGNFLTHIAKMVVNGGLVVLNRLYIESHQDDTHRFLENVELYLKDVKTIIVPGKTNSDNMLIYGRA
jgi:spermidine synthase